MRVAFPGTQRTWCCDAFPSIEKIPRVQCPTLVIHGTDDDVIDFSHGVTIYEQCPSSVEPLWVAGAGHNDVELHAGNYDDCNFVLTHLLFQRKFSLFGPTSLFHRDRGDRSQQRSAAKSQEEAGAQCTESDSQMPPTGRECLHGHEYRPLHRHLHLNTSHPLTPTFTDAIY